MRSRFRGRLLVGAETYYSPKSPCHKSGLSGLKSKISNLNPSAPWLVFCSPPFEFYVSRLADMLELIASLWSAAPEGSLFLVEADERLDFGLLPEPARWDVRNYRPAIIGLATKA